MIIEFRKIQNLKTDKNTRRFFRAINEFLPYLYSEFVMSFNLNSETELYSDIRKCIQEQVLSYSELVLKLKQNEKACEMISLFPSFDVLDQWERFFLKCSWESTEKNNIFYINGHKFITSKMFVTLVENDNEYFAYKYSYDKDNGMSSFEAFNTEIPPVDSIEIDNPFIFAQDLRQIYPQEAKTSDVEMTEEEFFNLDSIKSSDDEQKKAIVARTDKNIVILAGAGSGKTRTLVSRLVYLHMVKKIPLERILLLTFTNNAADNMKIRGETILNPIYEQIENGRRKPNIRAKTIDSFIYGLLKENYSEVGFTEEPTFKLDGTHQTKSELYSLVDDVIHKNGMDSLFEKNYYSDGKPNSNFKYLVWDIEKYACGMQINYAGIERLFYEVLQAQIKNNVIYGFVYANCLIKNAINNPASSMKDIISSRYSCILIDEFQDINILQNSTFEPFYNTDMHFTFVGDDDQSIYGWRGSDNSIIKNLVNDTNVETYYLLTNYRNNPNIVKAGNVILNHISGRAKKNQIIRPKKVTGAKIRIATYDEKYTNIANEIQRLIQNGYNAEDICILSRTNQDKGIISRALNAAEIPVAKDRIKPDVNDNYKLLKAIISILNEFDIISACREIKRIIDVPNKTDGFIQKVVLGKKRPDDNLINVYLLAEELRNNNIDSLAKCIYIYSLKAAELFEKAINDRHSDFVFEAFELFCSNNTAPWPISSRQLKDIFRTFEDNVRKENQNGGTLENGVKISTIHSTKGLEYDVVLITGLSLGKYPNTEQIDKIFNARNAQLQTLQGSNEALKNIKNSIDNNIFVTMLHECINPLFDRVESHNFKEFRKELVLCSSKEILTLTANGVDSFLDSYDYYILPLENRYINNRSKIAKQAMMYCEKQEILNESIFILSQENGDVSRKKKDLESVTKKLECLRKKLKKCDDRFIHFEESIKTIKAHYKTCRCAKSYLAEIRKSDEIEKLKRELINERERSVNEERRLFYVALTRARDILYLCNESGAPKSQFITVIPDELKEEYAVLTKEDEREFNRLKMALATEMHKDEVSNDVVDVNIEKLVNNHNFKDYIDSKYKEFLKNNIIYNVLPEIAMDFFKKAMALLYIGEFTGSDFKTEFAHNMQRVAEVVLSQTSGNGAKLFKTADEHIINKIQNDIMIATKHCITYPPNKNYVHNLITRESKYGDDLMNLKSAGVFHYIIRSGKYPVADDIINSWTKKNIPGDADKFIAAVVDIANIRNVMIHPSEKKWPEDMVTIILAHTETIIKNCILNKKQTLASSDYDAGELEIDIGVQLVHNTFGHGIVISNYDQSFTVNFANCGNKVFMKHSAEKYFRKV